MQSNGLDKRCNYLNAKWIYVFSHNHIIICMMDVSVVFITKNRFECTIMYIYIHAIQ